MMGLGGFGFLGIVLTASTMAGFSANVAGSDTAMVRPVGLSPQFVTEVSAAWQPEATSSKEIPFSEVMGRMSSVLFTCFGSLFPLFLFES